MKVTVNECNQRMAITAALDLHEGILYQALKHESNVIVPGAIGVRISDFFVSLTPRLTIHNVNMLRTEKFIICPVSTTLCIEQDQ